LPTYFLDPSAPPDGLDFTILMQAMRHPLKKAEFYLAFRNACVSTYLAHSGDFLGVAAIIPLVEYASKKSCNGEVYQLDLEDIQGLHVYLTHARLINFAVVAWDRYGETRNFKEVKEAYAEESSVIGDSLDRVTRGADMFSSFLDDFKGDIEEIGRDKRDLSGGELHGDYYACFICDGFCKTVSNE
jgi:hypothetical protein